MTDDDIALDFRCEHGIFNQSDVIGILDGVVTDGYPSRRAFAKAHGICGSNLCNVANGKERPHGKILDALGLRMVVAYVDKDNPKFLGFETKRRDDVAERWRVQKSIDAKRQRLP